MKVAIVHDWLTGMRGGEKCLEVFCELFPRADIYTLLHAPGAVSPIIEEHRIRTSFIQRMPRAVDSYRYYLPFFPLAVRRFDLTGYDLVLSSSHCVAKGVRVAAGTCHISYTHTPMRYIWDQYDAYFGNGRAGPLVGGGMRMLRPWLQRWDIATSRNVHYFIANSRFVAQRIRRYYARDAAVIHPPVDVGAFSASSRDDGFYLMVTALAPYKRVDLAIEAFNRLGAPLKIIGSGQDEARLRALAGPNVELCGWRSDRELRMAYAGCRALIFPGEEDFGIVPVEAMASGKPVIAFGRGGALETVVPMTDGDAIPPHFKQRVPTGVFFGLQTADALVEAVRYFEARRGRFDAIGIRRHAESFSRARFKDEVGRFIALRCEQFSSQGPRDASPPSSRSSLNKRRAFTSQSWRRASSMRASRTGASGGSARARSMARAKLPSSASDATKASLQ